MPDSPHLPPRRRRWRATAVTAARYAASVGLVLVAKHYTGVLQPTVGETISPLYFAAVALSSGFGGVGPGLLACGLSGFWTAADFPNPPKAGPFWWDDLIRVCVFLTIALIISGLAHLRRRALADVRRANDGLEQRVRDRTAELERTTALVRESEDRFRALVDGATDYAMCMLDAAGRVIGWNAGAQRTLGYDGADARTLSVAEFYPPDARDRGDPAAHLSRAAAVGRSEDEGWRVRRDGSSFWANAIITALHDPEVDGRPGPLRGFAHVLRDITEVKRLEKEVLETREAEQRRIGQDLHDGLGQELTGLSFLTQNLRRKLADAGRDEAAEADRIATLIARTIGQTRELARGLSPVELGADGLAASLRNLAASVHATYGIPCHAACDSSAKVEDHVASVHLYRIAQEALTNAARHASARAIGLRLEAAGPHVVLTVADDGVGLPATAPAHRGLGLRLMQYRARSIGATLAVRSGPDGGTAVQCAYAGNAYADRATGDATATEADPHDRHAVHR